MTVDIPLDGGATRTIGFSFHHLKIKALITVKGKRGPKSEMRDRRVTHCRLFELVKPSEQPCKLNPNVNYSKAHDWDSAASCVYCGVKQDDVIKRGLGNGTAQCHEIDNFSKATGRKVALEKALLTVFPSFINRKVSTGLIAPSGVVKEYLPENKTFRTAVWKTYLNRRAIEEEKQATRNAEKARKLAQERQQVVGEEVV